MPGALKNPSNIIDEKITEVQSRITTLLVVMERALTNLIAAFSIEQVHRLTGLSISRLTGWDNDAFYQPSLAYKNRRSPYSRIYTFEDLVALRTLSLLRERVSMQHLRRAAVKLREHSGRPWSELTLYVVNREVHFKPQGSDQIQGAVSGQIALAIPLSSVAEDMQAKSEKMRLRDNSLVGKIEQHRFVMGGDPVIAGTRVLVSSIKAFARAGYSIGQIIEQYPSLKKQDVQAVLKEHELTQAA